MPYCIYCNQNPCVCLRGKVKTLTVEIDEDTWKAIEQEAGGGSIEEKAARILTEHVRREGDAGPDSWMR